MSLIWTKEQLPGWPAEFQPPPLRVSRYWRETKDGNGQIRSLLANHYSYNPKYSRYGDAPKLFVGPGEKLVLTHIPTGYAQCEGAFVWRKFIDDSGQQGVNCAIFRNESKSLASEMILDAEHWARDRWGSIRAYTYIDPKRVSSLNPGYCYKKAHWRQAGHTKSGLIILEKQL